MTRFPGRRPVAHSAATGRVLPRATEFAQLLALQQSGDAQFVSTVGGPADHATAPAIYGGQIAAQALYAAGLTVDRSRRAPHAMRCQFLASGLPDAPVTFDVALDRDGSSFSARRVSAWQGGHLLCTLAAGFVAAREDGWRDQAVAAPAVPGPEESEPVVLGKLVSFEGRNPDPLSPLMDRPPRFWARAASRLAPDPLTQAAALAYVSDVATGSPAATDGSARPRASLDHALWFHGPTDLNGWLLVDQRHIFTGRGRTFFDGQVFDGGGVLVASIAQEELFR